MAGPGTKAASGRRSISRRLTVSLAAAVLLSTLCALVFFSLSYREHEAEHLQAMADDYADYLAQSLAVPVWELSEPTITAIGQAFAHNELVTRLVIVDERAQVLFRWDRDQTGPAVEQVTPIMRQGRVIGTVELALGTEWVTREERRILSAAGLTVLLAVAVVTVLTGMLLRINLKKPLELLGQVLGRYTRGDYEATRTDMPYVEFAPAVDLLSEMGATIRDQLTRLSEAEAKYRQIFENAQEGIFRCDQAGNLLDANPALTRLLNGRPGDLALTLGRDFLGRVFAEADEAEAFGRALSGQRAVSGFEARWRRLDGTVIRVAVSARIEDRNAGQWIVEGLVQDVSARKRAEEALERLARRLEELVAVRTRELSERTRELTSANHRLLAVDAQKSAFMTTVSHDIRTPMTSLIGFARLVSRDFTRHFLPLAGDGKLAERARTIRQNLAIIEQEGQRLMRLTNDFLDLSRIESGRVDWQDAPVDVSILARDALRSIAGALAEKPEIETGIEIEPGLPPLIADPDRLHQVLVNLLHNAVKFTAAGRVRLTVRRGDGTVRFEVADTGRGIPAAQLPLIFEKFHQVFREQTGDDKPQGSGLGLSICKGIVEHYGGRIWAESRNGGGSLFVVELPVSHPAGQDERESHPDLV